MNKMAVIIIAVVMFASATAACSVSEVCSDVESSFVGTIITDGYAPTWTITVEWSSDAEPLPPMAPHAPTSATSVMSATLHLYRLSRCSSPSECEWIAQLRAVGSCGSIQPYVVLDTALMVDSYRLEVVLTDGSVACAVDTVPQRSSSSSGGD